MVCIIVSIDRLFFQPSDGVKLLDCCCTEASECAENCTLDLCDLSKWVVALVTETATDALDSTAPEVVALVPVAMGAVVASTLPVVVALVLGTTGGVLDVTVPEVVALVPGRLENGA